MLASFVTRKNIVVKHYTTCTAVFVIHEGGFWQSNWRENSHNFEGLVLMSIEAGRKAESVCNSMCCAILCVVHCRMDWSSALYSMMLEVVPVHTVCDHKSSPIHPFSARWHKQGRDALSDCPGQPAPGADHCRKQLGNGQPDSNSQPDGNSQPGSNSHPDSYCVCQWHEPQKNCSWRTSQFGSSSHRWSGQQWWRIFTKWTGKTGQLTQDLSVKICHPRSAFLQPPHRACFWSVLCLF